MVASFHGMKMLREGCLRPSDAPTSNPSQSCSDPGVLTFEYYCPSHCTSVVELEEYHGCKGQYTVGRGQESVTFCGDDEDTVSIAKSALTRLMMRCELNYEEIGRLEVGTESQVDRAKSIKSFLMEQFEAQGVFDVKVVDTYNACYSAF